MNELPVTGALAPNVCGWFPEMFLPPCISGRELAIEFGLAAVLVFIIGVLISKRLEKKD